MRALTILAFVFLLVSAAAASPLAEAKGKPDDRGRPDAPPGLSKKVEPPPVEPAPEPAPTPAPAPAPVAEPAPAPAPESAPMPAPAIPASSPAPVPEHDDPSPLDAEPTAPPAADARGDAPEASRGEPAAPSGSASRALDVLVHPLDDAAPQESAALAVAPAPRANLPVAGILGGGLFVGAAALVIALRGRATPVVVAARAERVPLAPVAPDDVPGLLRHGQAAVERGELRDALGWFDRAVRAAPRVAVAHFCRGVCLGALGRVEEAYAAHAEAVKHAPEEWSYRVHLARVALAVGRTADALDALSPVARALPETHDAMLEDPQLAALRDHPRFLAMLGKL